DGGEHEDDGPPAGESGPGHALLPLDRVAAGRDSYGREGELSGKIVGRRAVEEDGPVIPVAPEHEEPGRVRRQCLEPQSLGTLLEDPETARDRESTRLN